MFTGSNQDAEEIGLCDFVGRPIVIDVSTAWCTPCQQLAAWLAGESEFIPTLESGVDPDSIRAIRDMVDDGTLVWLTALHENADHGEPTVETVQIWDEAFPHEKIHVLADTGSARLCQN